MELEAQQPWSYYLKAQSEYGAGHFSGARVLLEKELARHPDHYALNYALALVWLQLHDNARAGIYMERAIALCPVPRLQARYRMQLDRLKSQAVR